MQKILSSVYLIIFCAVTSTANNDITIRNVEACISFDKSGNSQLNIGWDSNANANGISVFYKTTKSSETKLSYEYSENVIFGLTVNGNPIGSNLTVQVAALQGKSLKEGTRSNPVTTVVNYVYSVTWKRISANHVEFNCSLACRTSIQACEVRLDNKTSNVSTNIVKLEFSTWATVNFYSLDPQENYEYEVFARTNSVNGHGLMVQGVLPPYVQVTTDPISTSTVNYTNTFKNDSHIPKTSETSVVAATVAAPVDHGSDNKGSVGVIIGVVVVVLLIILVVLILVLLATMIWKQKHRKGNKSKVSNQNLAAKEGTVQCKSTINSNEQESDGRTIKDKDVSVINIYEEISDIPVHSKPVPAFSASTGNIVSPPVSLKRSSLPCITNFQQIHVCNNLFHLHESSEKCSSKETISKPECSANEGSGDDSEKLYYELENLTTDHEAADSTPNKTKRATEEDENPYFELVDPTMALTTSFYENVPVEPLDTRKENKQPVDPKATQTVEGHQIENRNIHTAKPLGKRRSLNNYAEPMKVNQVIDPSTGHTYTLPFLRRKQ